MQQRDVVGGAQTARRCPFAVEIFFIPDLNRLNLAGVAAQNLLPPGLTFTEGEGAMVSAHSNLFVRYRPVPLAIEVLALGREPRDGPALLVRVPDDSTKDGGASLFMATRIRDVNVPPAFLPASEVISAGWSLEPLRALK